MGEGKGATRTGRGWLKRAIVALLLALALVPAPTTPAPTGDGATLDGATLAVEQGWARLTITGTPYQMGFQQGTLLRPYLRDLVATNLYPSLQAAGIPVRDAQRYARLLVPELPPSLLREMEGIAAGAGLAVEDVLLWNLRPDLLELGEGVRWLVPPMLRGLERPLASDPPPVRGTAAARLPWPTVVESEANSRAASVALAVGGEATIEQQGWLAATLVATAGERFLLVVRHPTTGHPSAGLALPGEVGLRAGINGARVALVAAPFATADRSPQGIPPFMLLRQTLEQADHAGEATHFLVDAHPGSGAILLVVDRDRAERVELSARQRRVSGEGATSLVAAGPPLEGPLALSAAPLREEPGPQQGRLAAWLRANEGFIGQQGLQALLADPAIHGGRSGAALLWQAGSSNLWLAQGAEGKAAPASGWHSFDMEAWWGGP